MEILKAHGSRNDIIVVDGGPDEHVGPADVPGFVRRLCDRSGPLGADGVYFVDSRTTPATATFVNPDGSPSAFCGNGMRAVGRLLLDRYGTDETTVRSGADEFQVHRAEPTPEGVAQIVVDLPAVDFDPTPAVVAGGGEHVDEPMPALRSGRRFTALAVPNSHLVSVVDRYDEAELVADGRRVAASPGTFPLGANLSYVLVLGPGEVFVRTYERGAGLTLSCGSGIVASRAVCSRLGIVDPGEPVVVRNAGGPARSWIREVAGRWLPSLEGNATFVYRARFDPALLDAPDPTITREIFLDEATAFGALHERNLAALRSAGVAPVPA